MHKSRDLHMHILACVFAATAYYTACSFFPYLSLSVNVPGLLAVAATLLGTWCLPSRCLPSTDPIVRGFVRSLKASSCCS